MVYLLFVPTQGGGMEIIMRIKKLIIGLMTAALMISGFGGVSFAETFGGGYSIDVSSDMFGNIFYERDVKFTQTFKSPTDKTVVVINKVVDDKGIVKDENLSRMNLGANTARKVEYSVGGLNYGVYTLKTMMYSIDNVYLGGVDTDFSVVKPANTVNDEVGIHVLFSNESSYMPRLSDIVELYKKTGFSSFRDSGWTWNEIERNKGTYSLKTFFRNEKALISDGGHSMLLTLSHGHDAYTGAYNKFATTETELEGWKNYCKNLALLTNDTDVSFEVFNEFDMKATPQEYFPLLKYAYEGIKEGNPNAKLIGMVTSYCNLNFIKTVIELGGDKYLDAISVHPYTWSYTPEQFELMDKIKSVRDYMDNNGMKDKELIITELGYYGFVGREQQASNYVRTLALNKTCGVADKFYFFRYAAAPKDTIHEDFGLICGSSDNTPFAAHQAIPALSNYNSIMTGAEYEKTIADGCYQYRLKNGKHCIMLWSDTPKNVTLNLGVSAVTLGDMYGNEQTLVSQGGEYTFSATANISYIMGDFGLGEIVQSPTYISLDTAIIKNTNNDFSKLNIIGTGIGCADDIYVSVSENVATYKKDAESGAELGFLNMSDKDGYAELTVKNDGAVVYSGRVLIQKQCGDNVIYDSRTDGYRQNYHNGIYNCETDSGKAILIFDTANKYVFHTVSSAPFTATSDVIINADVKIQSTANAVLSVSDGSTDTEVVRADESGAFVCGGTAAVQKTYVADTWYNIECVYSTSNKEFKIYVDGEYIGTKSGVGFSDGIKGFSFKATSAADSEVYLNNLRVSEYKRGGMTIKSVIVSDDNSLIDVEFSDAISTDEDLSALSVADENGDLIPIGNIERISAARYRAEIYEPLESNKMYTVFVDGVIKGGANIVCSRDEICVYSNPTGYLPTVTAIYSRDAKIRTAANRFSPSGGIIAEFSRPLGDNLDLDDCIALTRGDTAVKMTVESGEDKKSVIITPSALLGEGEEYVLSLSGLESCDGIPFDDKSLKFIAQSGYAKTADSTVNASDFSVSGDYASGRVTIKGKTDVPNDTVTIMATKPDSTKYNKDTIAAIREVTCGDGGEFEFSFTTDKVAGEYKIFVNSLSTKNKKEKGLVFRNFLPEIRVSRKGAAVTKMSELKTGDDIDVYVGGFNMTADFGGYVMLAQYGGGVLKDVQCVDASRNSTYVGSEVNINAKVADGVERIKVMYLTKPSNAPVFAAYNIK